MLAAINDYRAHPQRCERRAVQSVAPLTLKSSLALPVGYDGRLRETLKESGYQAATVRTIRLVGAEDAEAAFAQLRRGYCAALLDKQFTDLGVSRRRNEWRVVLARPLRDNPLGDGRAVGKTLLAQFNAARAKPRLCGRQRFAAARPLTWNSALGAAAQEHSRSMANDNYFAHCGRDGDSPTDRARPESRDGTSDDRGRSLVGLR